MCNVIPYTTKHPPTHGDSSGADPQAVALARRASPQGEVLAPYRRGRANKYDEHLHDRSPGSPPSRNHAAPLSVRGGAGVRLGVPDKIIGHSVLGVYPKKREKVYQSYASNTSISSNTPGTSNTSNTPQHLQHF